MYRRNSLVSFMKLMSVSSKPVSVFSIHCRLEDELIIMFARCFKATIRLLTIYHRGKGIKQTKQNCLRI